MIWGGKGGITGQVGSKRWRRVWGAGEHRPVILWGRELLQLGHVTPVVYSAQTIVVTVSHKT